jgi:hypothetical protein
VGEDTEDPLEEIADPLPPDSVGYGKPPKQHRFQKGRSGNPSGRRREKRNLYDVLDEVLDDKVPVKNGRAIPGQDVVAHRIIELAMKGDPRAFRQFIQLARRAKLFEDLSGRRKRIFSGDPEPEVREEIEKLRRKLKEFDNDERS